MGKKTLITIISIILVGILGFCVCWIVINFDKVQDGMKGSSLFSQEDIDAAYKDGYDKALSDGDDLLMQIEELRSILSGKELELKNLNSKLSDYNSIKSELDTLKQEKAMLEKEISNLQKSIATYLEFIEQIKLEDSFIVTYYFDGYVYDIQRYDSYEQTVLRPVETPSDTDNVKFLGWMLDEEDSIIENDAWGNMVIDSNHNFTAKLSKSYDVNFLVDGEIYSTQKVAEFGSCTLPLDTPDKYGYVFKGWSTDGVTVLNDIENEVITSTTNYIAVFELFEVQIQFRIIKDGYKRIFYYEILTDMLWTPRKDGEGYLFFYSYYVEPSFDNRYQGKYTSDAIILGILDTPGDFSLPVVPNMFFTDTNSAIEDFDDNVNIVNDTIYTFYLLSPKV